MNVYREHGTKILGAIITVLGGFLLLPPDQQVALVGETAPKIAVSVTGLLTILRGFQNSRTQSGGPQP
jgi:hypothetical protein